MAADVKCSCVALCNELWNICRHWATNWRVRQGYRVKSCHEKRIQWLLFSIFFSVSWTRLFAI